MRRGWTHTPDARGRADAHISPRMLVQQNSNQQHHEQTAPQTFRAAQMAAPLDGRRLFACRGSSDAETDEHNWVSKAASTHMRIQIDTFLSCPAHTHSSGQSLTHTCTRCRCNGSLTVQHVHVHRLRIRVRRQTRVLARIGDARPLNEQIGGGDLALFGDYRDSAAGRVVVDFLHAAAAVA